MLTFLLISFIFVQGLSCNIRLHLFMLQFSLGDCGCSNKIFEVISGKGVIAEVVFAQYATNLSSSRSAHKNQKRYHL